jgi:hypothetical protein
MPRIRISDQKMVCVRLMRVPGQGGAAGPAWVPEGGESESPRAGGAGYALRLSHGITMSVCQTVLLGSLEARSKQPDGEGK